MAISMTGFGRGEYKDDNYQFLVECKTINHKYADINIRLPRKLSFLEDKARILIKDYIHFRLLVRHIADLSILKTI